jgi:hypothetical protein
MTTLTPKKKAMKIIDMKRDAFRAVARERGSFDDLTTEMVVVCAVLGFCFFAGILNELIK